MGWQGWEGVVPEFPPSADGGGLRNSAVAEAASPSQRDRCRWRVTVLQTRPPKDCQQPDTLKTAKWRLKWKRKPPAETTTKTHGPRVPGKADPQLRCIPFTHQTKRTFPGLPPPRPNWSFNRQVSNRPWRRQPIGAQTIFRRSTHVSVRRKTLWGAEACARRPDPAPFRPVRASASGPLAALAVRGAGGR